MKWEQMLPYIARNLARGLRRMCFTETIVCYAAGDVVAGLSKYSVIIKNVTGARGIGPVDKVTSPSGPS